MTKPLVAYYRVSTARQGASGLGLEAQQAAVQAYAGGRPILMHFREVESGRNADRPKLREALAYAKKHGAVLVIAKLDRLARSVSFISQLMDSGTEFAACDFPEANRLTLHIMAAVAEHEADATSKRTKAALQAAKARGTRLGNGGKGLEVARASLSLQAEQRRAEVRPIIREIERAGITSHNGIAEALNARGIPTARGGKWHATQVRRTMEF